MDADEDTMRPEYDFSHGKRGVTTGRYASGAKVVVTDPPHKASAGGTVRRSGPAR